MRIYHDNIKWFLDFPYRTEFNSEILRMQEDGTIDRLKDRWWKQLNPKNNCTVRIPL